MVDDVGSTEVEPEYRAGLHQGAQEATDVCPTTMCVQRPWDTMAVQSRGLEMAAYRSYAMAVRRKHSVRPIADEEKILSSTAQEEYGLLLLKKVNEHLGSHHRGVADVNEGQVAEEEIHG